ncbi:hypothetical protein GCM10010294_67860 [Streptomyces griseoloalbus]|uniref:hypothetical protein n=1 Tax=Streptomyces griseoloalbus TaxID=67303 RepID=UPI0018750ADA|nr:hypothetical protein GCM10010294_67860 [Streptomyces griseoloalbus]
MGIFNRRETAADDQARTTRLLNGLEAAYAARTGDPCGDADLDDFEEVIVSATGAECEPPYPPAGHTYPRR